MKDLPGPFIEGRIFLDAEVIADNVQRRVGHVTYRRDIARTMPCSLYSILFGQDRYLRAGLKPPACETCTRM